MKTWYIWSEGWSATGQWGSVDHHGSIDAETFEEACKEFFKNDSYFDDNHLTYWGCRLYPSKELAEHTP